MRTEDNAAEQKRKLDEMNYNPGEDIFNKEEHISLDGDGNPIINPSHVNDGMPYGLDIPGAEDDDNFDQITNQQSYTEDNIYNKIEDKDELFETEDDLIDDIDKDIEEEEDDLKR
ncbi:hypothetical protein [Chryseobacterium sp.]|uniref:hypothetical protein n=1 Tax=Chryseobacterium sp. TaxID=1871047 RepID=UPI002FCA5D0D